MASSNKKIFDEINITPLTDIFLVLLVIMMVVAPLLTFRELDVSFGGQANAAGTPDSPEEKGMLLLSIDSAGTITVGGEAVNPDELPARLRQLAVENPEGLRVNTDPKSPFLSMADAMDAARAAGIVNISVVEEAGAGETPAGAPAPVPPQ